ncbi:MAG: hypothetical protein Q7K54_02415 [Candidatus Parcubacteria bacterium]|nr:hypothetical protein [Candidatus Parcubacteria bacterium]
MSNKIYTKKTKVIGQEGLGVIVNIVSLFVYELLLSVVSLPLYLGLKTAKVTAFFKEKGAYEKIDYDYNLRRVLTLTGVSIVLVIWLAKLSLIIFVPQVYGVIRNLTGATK